MHQKAKDLLTGRKHDETFYPVIYGAEEDDDWTDPKVWKKVNPSLGITVSIDKIKAACQSAKQNPAEENSFRQLRLNQTVVAGRDIVLEYRPGFSSFVTDQEAWAAYELILKTLVLDK